MPGSARANLWLPQSFPEAVIEFDLHVVQAATKGERKRWCDIEDVHGVGAQNFPCGSPPLSRRSVARDAEMRDQERPASMSMRDMIRCSLLYSDFWRRLDAAGANK